MQNRRRNTEYISWRTSFLPNVITEDKKYFDAALLKE